MSVPRLACLLCWLASSVASAQAPPPPPGPVHQTLTLTLAIAGKQVECEVPFGPITPVLSLAFSPDGKRLASSGYREVLLWDLTQARLAARLGAGTLGEMIHTLAFTRDGRTLLVGDGSAGQPGAVRLVDTAGGQVQAVLEGPTDAVYSLALSPDERLVAAGGADGKVYVWELASRKLVTSFGAHTGWLHCLAFSPDGKTLVTGGADEFVVLWQTADWKQALKLNLGDSINGLTFSPDSAQVAVAVGGAAERKLHFRDREKGVGEDPIDLGMCAPVGLVWDAASGMLWMPCTDKTLKSADSAKPKGGIAKTLSGHGDWVYCVALDSAGGRLASGCADGTIKLWKLADGAPLATLAQLAPASNRWLITTTPGYANTSAPDLLTWRTGGTTLDRAAVNAALLIPKLTQAALAGQPVPAVVNK